MDSGSIAWRSVLAHITILALGSRGDVQPLVALGVGLQKAGYQVRLAASENFETLVRDRGLEFALLRGDVQEYLQSPAGQKFSQSRDPIALAPRIPEMFTGFFASAIPDCWQACQGTDAIVAGSATFFWSVDIAEALSIPLYAAVLQPLSPTAAFPNILFPPVFGRLGGGFNRFSYAFAYRLIWYFCRQPVNHFRTTVLNLAPVRKTPLERMYRQGAHILNAVSPSVLPRPQDWGEQDHMTGYWFLDRPSDFVPPPDLVDFLAAGEPPVYIGFGSMSGAEARKVANLALAALEKTGQRGLFLTGWSNIDTSNLPDTIFKLRSIPHDWLFPQVACVVHHGGAGTTAATLRAGIPGVVIPFLADQPFWADRVFRLGVSPAPVTPKKRTVEQVATAIVEAVQNQDMIKKATQLGEKIRAEDGVAQTIAMIQKHCP